jgi:HEPN domain-containing protein
MEARHMPWEERKQIAKEDYEYWFTKGVEFLIECKYPFRRRNYPLSAFLFHQATESFYNAIILVFTGYKFKEHDLLELGKKARDHHHELFRIFPYASPEQVKSFELLRKAYIEARYNKHYTISKEQLLYLIERIKKLRQMTETICLEYINREEG